MFPVNLKFQSWSALFILLAILTSLMRIMSKSFWSITFILINLTRIFTSQSSQFTRTKIFDLPLQWFKKLNLIILICIILQSASILTKAFTGLLLSTYSNIRYIPISESFEQIDQDQNLEVHTYLGDHQEYLKSIPTMNSKLIANLIERDKIFRRKNKLYPRGMYINDDNFMKIVTGKLVFICDSYMRKTFETRHSKWKNMLSVSKNMNWNLLENNVLPKNSKLTLPLFRM